MCTVFLDISVGLFMLATVFNAVRAAVSLLTLLHSKRPKLHTIDVYSGDFDFSF